MIHDEDPIIAAWRRRDRIKNGWLGLLIAVLVAGFVAGAWWLNVATKPWVEEYVDDAKKEMKIDQDKFDNVRIDVGIIKERTLKLESEQERSRDRLLKLYEELGAIPEIKKERKMKKSTSAPPSKPR